MRVFHARVKDGDVCVFDTQARFTSAFWAQYLRPVLYIAFLADVFHFLQDQANFWQTDLC